jgi:hypothetical protein
MKVYKVSCNLEVASCVTAQQRSSAGEGEGDRLGSGAEQHGKHYRDKGDHERQSHSDHAHPNEQAVAKPPVARRKPHMPTALRVAANRSPEYREPYAFESESDNRGAQQRHATGGALLIGRRVVDHVVGVVHAAVIAPAAVVLVIGWGVVVAAVDAEFARHRRSNTISEGCWPE